MKCRIQKENNRLLIHRYKFYLYKLIKEQAAVLNREFTEIEINNIRNHLNYVSDEE